MGADITVMVLLSLILASITKRGKCSARVTITEFLELRVRSPSRRTAIARSLASGGLSLTGIATGVDSNLFPLSNHVLDLRTAFRFRGISVVFYVYGVCI